MTIKGQMKFISGTPTIVILLTVLIISVVFKWPIAPTALSLVYLALVSYCAGKKFFNNLRPGLAYLMGFVTVVGYVTVGGTILFYAFSFSLFSQVILLMGSLAVAISPPRRVDHPHINTSHWPKKPLSATSLTSIGVYLLSCALIAYYLVQHQTLESITTPWPHLPSIIFVLFFMAIVALVILVASRSSVHWPLVIPLFIVALGVTTILLPLGYGFDPFIHQGTEQILLETGTIHPKPLYYVGFYTLVVLVAQVTGASVTLIDRFMLLALASVLLPWAVCLVYRHLFRERLFALLAPAALLLAPYPELIQSTPQGASFLWSLLTIVVSQLYMRLPYFPFWPLALMALTATAFHPITGIPVMLFVLSLALFRRSHSISRKTVAAASTTLLALVTLPLAFFVASSFTPDMTTTFTTDGLASFAQTLRLKVYPYVTLDDLIYSFRNMRYLLVLLIAVVGIITFRKEKVLDTVVPHGIFFVTTFINYLTVRHFIQFDFASTIENAIFSERLLTLSFYFTVPFFIAGLYTLSRKALVRHGAVVVTLIVMLASSATLSLYLSYPRFDTREQNKGYSVSQYDLAAVRWIDTDALARPYVVLANQAVAAAAIRELGFQQYHNSHFYYPLPTNGPLHALFLRAVAPSSPIEDVIMQTQQLTGVHLVYVVINDYWSDADTLRELHRDHAQSVRMIGGEKIAIFTYQ